jgi:hypothetical protein
MSKRRPEPIHPTTALSLVGRRIFGDDWIGDLSASEENLIKEFGPQIEISPDQIFSVGSVKYCPNASRNQLDRALGRYLRRHAQWREAELWLKRHPERRSLSDRAEIEAMLDELRPAPTSRAGPGAKRPRRLREAPPAIGFRP